MSARVGAATAERRSVERRALSALDDGRQRALRLVRQELD